jgi:hypothetical protein
LYEAGIVCSQVAVASTGCNRVSFPWLPASQEMRCDCGHLRENTHAREWAQVYTFHRLLIWFLCRDSQCIAAREILGFHRNNMMIIVFWEVTPYRLLDKDQSLREICCLLLQCRRCSLLSFPYIHIFVLSITINKKSKAIPVTGRGGP